MLQGMSRKAGCYGLLRFRVSKENLENSNDYAGFSVENISRWGLV